MNRLRDKLKSTDKKQATRLLMIGLDGVGKTTILYKLMLGFDYKVPALPTIGKNIETIQHRVHGNVKNYTIWDMGGSHKLKSLWLTHLGPESDPTKGIILVIDTNDGDRLEAARAAFTKLLKEGGSMQACILILANKTDLPGTLSKAELADRLGTRASAMRNRRWHIQECCALTGEGVMQGLDWLCNTIEEMA